MKKTFTAIGNGILTFFNGIFWFFHIIFSSIGWFFKTIFTGIGMFFVYIGKGVHFILTKGFFPFCKKLGSLIKSGWNKLKDLVYALGTSIKTGHRKLWELSFMKKVKNVLLFIPNLLVSKVSYRKRQALWGVVFITPLLIGFIYFFFFPFITTVLFSFSNIYRASVLEETNEVLGVVTEWVGFDNYRFIWNVNSTFKDTLGSVFLDTLVNVLMITIFSLIIAVVLNSKFKGRSFVRAVFFMPVIFNSQAVDAAIKAGQALTAAMEESGQDIFSTMFNFKDFLTNANFPVFAVNFISEASSSIFEVISYSGVQILIFLSGIQSVPKHLYEAAKIEGATQYEIFWKITFPMVSPLMLTAGVYTVVDSFLRSDLLTEMDKYSLAGNVAYTLGLGNLTNDGVYAAMSMLFCVVSVIVVAIVLIAIRGMVFYYDE